MGSNQLFVPTKGGSRARPGSTGPLELRAYDPSSSVAVSVGVGARDCVCVWVCGGTFLKDLP